MDTTTYLPKRTESYRKKNYEKEYALKTIEIVTYPADKEIKAVIKSIFN